MANDQCKNGCPKGVDMRTCKRMLAHECPLLHWQGSELTVGNRQKQLFE